MSRRHMEELPVDGTLPRVLESLQTQGAVVICAEPGAGKTTRVPPALLDGDLLTGENPKVLLLQPRRVAARASAARIAFERGWDLGREVGYRVRFERRVSRETRLEVITEGILTRRLLDDPYLEGVGAVILDEFHERSLHTDLAIAMAREIRETVREDLKLVVMSATLEAEPISRYLGECPIVRVEGRAHPVTIEYRHPGPGSRLEEEVRIAVQAIADDQAGGDILVFLPGMEEIRRAARAIEGLASDRDWLVLPLHGSLSAAEQDRALQPARQRKVVLATNVAETSLTIEGVTTVIDSGLARVAVYDGGRGLDRLELKRISRASAAQRAGRAGRVGPGRCVRLWSERQERGMPDHEVPEVHRVDLSGALLMLDCWEYRDPSEFGWFEKPAVESIRQGQTLLSLLGALDVEGRVTEVGRRLLRWPVPPRLGRLLEEAAEAGRFEEAAALAALLEEKDLANVQRHDGGRRSFATNQRLRSDSDLLVRLDMLEEAERARFRGSLRERGIDPSAARRVAQARDNLIRLAHRDGANEPKVADGAGDEDELMRLVLLAYPDRVCRRRAAGSDQAVMVGGRGARLDASTTVREAELFVAVEARESTRGGAGGEVLVRVASLVRAEWLGELFPEQMRRVQEARFDQERQRVVGWTRWLYRDLLLREEPGAAVEPMEAGRVLAHALQARALEIFEGREETASLLARVGFLRSAMPEQALPVWDEPGLIQVLEEACAGCVSVSELTGSRLVGCLRTRLSFHHRTMLEQEAPEAIEVPSGSRIKLKYEAGWPPRLAARLQELFGWKAGPRLAGGRVPVVLELLGPNYRPVQVTEDLESFWNTTYTQVRKDLRNRFPKHAWPEDPWAGKPESRGGRRRGG